YPLVRTPPPHRPTSVPYTALFRSLANEGEGARVRLAEIEAEQEVARQELEQREIESHSVRTRRDELGPLIDSARSESDSLREKRSEEHTSELQSPDQLVCRLLLEK